MAVTARCTGLLLTGDTLYPGRLYVRDWAAFAATVGRLLAFAEDYPVRHLLGGHIEMTRRLPAVRCLPRHPCAALRLSYRAAAVARQHDRAGFPAAREA